MLSVWKKTDPSFPLRMNVLRWDAIFCTYNSLEKAIIYLIITWLTAIVCFLVIFRVFYNFGIDCRGMQCKRYICWKFASHSKTHLSIKVTSFNSGRDPARPSRTQNADFIAFVKPQTYKQYNSWQYYTLVEQKAILLIFISIIDKNINFRLKWNWRKGQFELIKMSIDSSLYSCILCLYLEVEKISVDHNLNWQIDKKVNLRWLKYQSTPLYIVA